MMGIELRCFLYIINTLKKLLNRSVFFCRIHLSYCRRTLSEAHLDFTDAGYVFLDVTELSCLKHFRFIVCEVIACCHLDFSF